MSPAKAKRRPSTPGSARAASRAKQRSGPVWSPRVAHVPQVARDLQTAQVIPPGAFPNGQGTGEQYGSEIPGWYNSLSTQESAATLAAWTAKQEQLKKEAEEKASEEGEVHAYGNRTVQGDPQECVIYANEPGQEGEVVGHTLVGSGEFVCNYTPVITLGVCLVEWTGSSIKVLDHSCKTYMYKGANAHYAEITVKAGCKVGHDYAIYAWITVHWYGGQTSAYAYSEWTTCEENEAEWIIKHV